MPNHVSVVVVSDTTPTLDNLHQRLWPWQAGYRACLLAWLNQALPQSYSDPAAERWDNRLGRWTCWEVGGYWPHFWMTHTGQRTASACKGAIDFQTMTAMATTTAIQEYTQAHQVIQGRTWVPQATLTATLRDPEQVQRIYQNQPVIRDLMTAFPCAPFTFDDVQLTQAAYVTQTCAYLTQPLAIVHQGHWYEQGTIGDDATPDDVYALTAAWTDVYTHVLAQVPTTTWLTLVDCHT